MTDALFSQQGGGPGAYYVVRDPYINSKSTLSYIGFLLQHCI